MEITNKYRLTILVLAVLLAYCLGVMTPFGYKALEDLWVRAYWSRNRLTSVPIER